MTTLQEIQDAAGRLTVEDRSELCKWLLEQDAEAWDQEIEADVQAGKLDFLAEEALQEYRTGKTRKL